MKSEEANNVLQLGKFLDQIEEIIEEFNKVVISLSDENKKLINEVSNLRLKISNLEDSNKKLISKIDELGENNKNYLADLINLKAEELSDQLSNVTAIDEDEEPEELEDTPDMVDESTMNRTRDGLIKQLEDLKNDDTLTEEEKKLKARDLNMVINAFNKGK